MTTLKKNQFKRKIGTFNVDFFRKNRKHYKFNYNRNCYPYYNIDFEFHKV